jgi:hypothetical protein
VNGKEEEITDGDLKEALRLRARAINRWTLIGAAALTAIACLIPF